MNRKLSYILLTLILGVICTTSCKDDFYYPDQIIGEGTAKISATVSFQPLVSSLDHPSRSAGDAIRTISDIKVVIYNQKGEWYDCVNVNESMNNLTITQADSDGANTDMPDPYIKGDQSESKTAKASFDLNNIPFGRYYMYVVVNYNDPIDETNAATPEELKKITVEWNSNNISANAQMFGCLATDNQKDYDDNAPLLTINKENTVLHSWIKRLASKLTLTFDGSGLHEGIFVYINKATIKDIPRYCHFGSNNAPYRFSKEKPTNISDSLIVSGESLFYHSDGRITSSFNQATTPGQSPDDSDSEAGSSSTTTTLPPFETIKKEWLEIDKATPIVGAVEGEVNHPETAQALYFYENCQGEFKDNPNKQWFNKVQNPDSVGNNLTAGDPDWKDNVPYGTYIEIEGYYSANYKGYISSGPITYRFMLGQDTDYNYNSLRNRHYKLTLKFKGYANQPDWHIVYKDDDPGLYPPEEYYMSYLYNVRQEMPIRLTGSPTKVTMQIIENNWAPYDGDEADFVPIASIQNPNGGLNFEWNKQVYANTSFVPGSGISDYTYGLHAVTSSASTPYSSDIINTPDRPDFVRDKVTPIWVGFLALQAPTGYEDESTPLPTSIYADRTAGDWYSNDNTIKGMKNYYYGQGDRMDNGRPANNIPLYENVYWIPDKEQLSSDPRPFKSGDSKNKEGRNGYTVALNGDESITINVPMFTQPKDMGYISGFSGNNPYESYYRKAVVKISAEYKTDEGTKTLVKYVPIFQMRRIINPKAVWRTWNDRQPFTVKLMVLDDFADTQFTHLESNGEWEAYVATPEHESIPLTGGTFTLAEAGSDGKVHGITGSKIQFTINFAGVGKNETKCGKIIVHYHGNNCEHAIFVRQGYNVPVVIGEDSNDKEWSSYAVFSFDEAADSYNGVFKPELTSTNNNTRSTWTLPASGNISGLKATLTVNPLALGTMFKRGNYQQGIRIINNQDYGPLSVPGSLQLTGMKSETSAFWNDIYGIPCLDNPAWNQPETAYGPSYYPNGNAIWNSNYKNSANSWEWSPFVSTVPDEASDNTYEYDVPTLDDYKVLLKEGFGIGVAYADGATTTSEYTSDAFGFFNVDNTITTSPNGMRGFIVYNTRNFNQIFFPIGFSGVGRRTISNASGNLLGTLRYGTQSKVLSVENNSDNQYRPISYNNPNNPGAIYWAKGWDTTTSTDPLFAFDLNFFDINIGLLDQVISWPNFGDAVPIKPVINRKINTNQAKISRK